MKLAIVAATGGIGRLTVAAALAAGHDVTAVARRPEAVDVDCRVVGADLRDGPAGLLPALRGADAVLSGLGPRGRDDHGVAAEGTAAIVAAMAEAGVSRLVAVSAAPIGTVRSPGNPHPPRHDPGDGPLIRYVGAPLVKRVLRGHYADLAAMEDVLRASGLAWTAVRPPWLTNGPRTGAWRWAVEQNLRGGTSISRADTAAFLLACLDLPATSGHAVGVAT